MHRPAEHGDLTGAVMTCSLLVHVIDGTSRDPIGDYQAIQQELQLFDSDLAAKPQLVAYNKMDVPDSSDYWDSVQDFLLAQVCVFVAADPAPIQPQDWVSGHTVNEGRPCSCRSRVTCCLTFAQTHHMMDKKSGEWQCP